MLLKVGASHRSAEATAERQKPFLFSNCPGAKFLKDFRVNGISIDGEFRIHCHEAATIYLGSINFEMS